MIELGHKVAHLSLETCDFSVAFSNLLFLTLEVKSFLIDKSVQFFDLLKSLRNIELQVANLDIKRISFVSFHIVGSVESIDFLQILAICLS